MVNVRAGGLIVAGGTSTGQTVSDNCEVRGRLPELSTATTGTSAFGAGLANSAVTPLSPYCHAAYGVLTQFRALSTYLVPRVEVQLSAVVQSKPGAMLAANYVVPNADEFSECWPVLRKYFGAVRPAAMMISAGLADPRMKIEIEVTARKHPR